MNICIYGASGRELEKKYFEDAYKLGEILAENGHTLIFGGGNEGLMGACAEGVKAENGRLIGIAPRFFDEPGILCQYCTEFIFTETMSERKKLMEDMADAFVVLPGGIGTFEEFFETLTLKQLGRHNKPMTLLNTLAYYEPMMKMLEAAADGGFLSRNVFKIFTLCDAPEDCINSLKTQTCLCGSVRRLSDYGK